MICLGVEVPTIMMFAWALRWAPADDLGWLALLALATTCLTQPPAWWLLDNAPIPLMILVPVLWVSVTIAEGLAHGFVLRMSRRRALVLAALTNTGAVVALMGSAGMLGWVP